jgi:hypothetical protein
VHICLDNKTLFPKDARYKLRRSNDKQLRLAIFRKFMEKPSYLLILDHADTLKHAEGWHDPDAIVLGCWLQDVVSKSNIVVKIVATSLEPLRWSNEHIKHLDGFMDSDITGGIELFSQSLSYDVRARVQENIKKTEDAKETTKQLLYDLVARADGHPSSLVLLGRSANRTQYSNKLLEDIINHYSTMIAEEDVAEKSLKKHFGPMIDTLGTKQRLFLYMCSLFTGPITAEILEFLSYFIDYVGETLTVQACTFVRDFVETRDSRLETIMKNLEQSLSPGLFNKREKSENHKQQEYNIHVGFREALRQHNNELGLQLQLPIVGLFDNTFIIGVPSEQGE